MGGPDCQFKNYIHKIFNKYIFHESECSIQDFVSANSLVFIRTAFVAVSESGCTALETMPSQYLKNKLVISDNRHGSITPT